MFGHYWVSGSYTIGGSGSGSDSAKVITVSGEGVVKLGKNALGHVMCQLPELRKCERIHRFSCIEL